MGGGNNNSGLQSLAVGDTYHGCFVLAKTETTVTLLSATQEDNVILNSDASNNTKIAQKVNAKLATWSVAGVDATWRLPTEDEMNLLKNHYNEIMNDEDNGEWPAKFETYFYIYNNNIFCMGIQRTSGNVTISDDNAIGNSSTILRPVTTLNISD